MIASRHDLPISLDGPYRDVEMLRSIEDVLSPDDIGQLLSRFSYRFRDR